MSLDLRTPLTALIFSAALCTAVSAQDSRLLLELYGGAAQPVSAFADGTAPGEGTTTGPSLGVLLALPGTGRRTLYAGFTQHRFGCEDAGCDPDGEYVATGFNVGLRFALLRERAAIPWLRVGAITTRVETGDLAGMQSSNAGLSKLGFGFEAGAGVYIGSRSPVAVNPSILYSAVNSELPGGSDLRLRYLTARIGLVLAF